MLVEKKHLKLSKLFKTELGEVIKNPEVVYEEYGNKTGPVIFLGHGGLSSQHAAGKYSENDSNPGWWDPLIGEGKLLDTNKYRIICANSLGSMYGSTGPLTINPDTGKMYGPDFPKITLIDQVKFYKYFLDELEVKELFMMAGVSMGSLHTLQMAVLYPDFVKSLVAVATAGYMPPGGLAFHNIMINILKLDPDFNRGWYECGVPQIGLSIITQLSKIYYTNYKMFVELCESITEGKDIQQLKNKKIKEFLQAGVKEAIETRDPNSYITMLEAINSYDLSRGFSSFKEAVKRIKCPALIMNIDSDCEFPPEYAYEIGEILNNKKTGQARVEILKSKMGHLGCIYEFGQLEKYIGDFIKALEH
ncbi:Homoserine O-acetyltransferase [Caldisalinibacter kiritimatiensis]|uniref:Probable acyltransferase n=1 Tax=Caldisalinibacter kiritimatiensis TaxID=1304284 RepID=R1CYB7_9FIRM|nr:Homoserine O-acetyltransferase [Caldisalinibacter kiritimatiensis]